MQLGGYVTMVDETGPVSDAYDWNDIRQKEVELISWDRHVSSAIDKLENAKCKIALII